MVLNRFGIGLASSGLVLVALGRLVEGIECHPVRGVECPLGHPVPIRGPREPHGVERPPPTTDNCRTKISSVTPQPNVLHMKEREGFMHPVHICH